MPINCRRAAPASRRSPRSSGPSPSRPIARCWSRSRPARSTSAISASCAAPTACRCATTSCRCPTAPARWSRSAPASRASRSATRSPAASSSAGPAASRRPTCRPSALGGSIDGMLAEYAVLEEEGVVKIPAHLSLEEGATLPCAGVTVWHAMMEHAKLDRRPDRAAAGHRRRLDLRAAIGARHGHPGRHHLVERRQARARQDARRQPRHQLQDHARLGEGGDGIHRRPRRRSGGRGRRRRHAGALVRRHPRRRQDQHDRRPERGRDRAQSAADPRPAAPTCRASRSARRRCSRR